MGGKIKLEIIESAFAGNISPQYELSVLIGIDSLSYCILDTQRRPLLLREYELPDAIKLGELLSQDALLLQTYAHRRVAIASPHFTLLPDRFFDPAAKYGYLQPLANLSSSEEVRFDKLPQFAATNVYAVNNAVLDATVRHLPGSRAYHWATALLCGLSSHGALPKRKCIYLHVHAGWLLLLVLDGDALLFSNVFNYQSAKDFLYYVMLIFDQFKLDPEETPAYLSGQLLQESEVYPLLYRYIRQLHFLPPHPNFLLESKFKALPVHLFFDLFSLCFCQ